MTYDWMMVMESVGEVKRIPLDEVMSLGVTEFFNMVGYITYKNKKMEERYKK